MLRNRLKANSIPSRLSPGSRSYAWTTCFERCVASSAYEKLRIKKEEITSSSHSRVCAREEGETESMGQGSYSE
ncbi:hypothetical protein PBY51_019840 [Eleginops maclovinus]|uniref:Uncharacterized protein n=1 Tax=Eleginops maclovinus TaxID=56733 RepID=A0AAN7XS19_ELEMC|nr:hypothetical protein PBY51_019840 [Eleginops maclovinus]